MNKAVFVQVAEAFECLFGPFYDAFFGCAPGADAIGEGAAGKYRHSNAEPSILQ